MINLGGGFIVAGILTAAMGLSGFIDKQKVERRSKAGHENDESDHRHFGRSEKCVLFGIGLCIVGAIVISVTMPSERRSSPASAGDVSSPDSPAVTATMPASSKAATPSSGRVRDTSSQANTATLSCVDDGTFFGANICKSRTLAAAYDLELREYEAVQASVGGTDMRVRTEQQVWLDTVRKTCPDMTCLTAAFNARIADLLERYGNDS
jgi:hypothetical protein